MSKFFYLPNLVTTDVTEIEKPWEIQVPADVQALDTDAYKRRWRNPDTKHWLLLTAEGRIEQQEQQHEGDEIQHQHHGLGEIPGEQGCAMVTGGKEKAHKTQEAAARQEQQPGHDLDQPGMGLFFGLFRQKNHLI